MCYEVLKKILARKFLEKYFEVFTEYSKILGQIFWKDYLYFQFIDCDL